MESPVELFQFEFTGRSFLYSVQIGGCQTNLSGVRFADYSSASHGSIGFYDIGNNTSGCVANLDELTGTVADVPVPFGVTETVARELIWELKNDGSLEMGIPILFKGSDAGPCGGSCLCSLDMHRSD